MIKLCLSKSAKSFLDKLDAKQFRQLAKKVFSLMENPKPHDVKALKETAYLRTDFGEYRIVYRIEQDILFVVVIGKRNDDEVYKVLKRKQ